MTLQEQTMEAVRAWSPSRRTFIKGSAAVLAAASGGPALSFFARVDPAQAQAQASVGEWMSTTCQGCTSWCSVQVKVVDGRAVHLRGNPHAKGNHGKICPRPHLALQQVYDPDRVRQPMKRTNPIKGRDQDPGFVPISWDEALGMLADKIMELRNDGEPEKFLLLRGRYTYMRGLLYSAVPKIIGSPNNISHSAICAEAEKFGPYYTEGLWDYRDYDLEHTRYVLCWGADPVSTNRQVPHAINFWGNMRDQATVSVVDPRLSATAAKANEWLPVIPGEDGALAVAMAHVILAEGAWNKSFVGDFADGKNRFVPGESGARRPGASACRQRHGDRRKLTNGADLQRDSHPRRREMVEHRIEGQDAGMGRGAHRNSGRTDPACCARLCRGGAPGD